MGTIVYRRKAASKQAAGQAKGSRTLGEVEGAAMAAGFRRRRPAKIEDIIDNSRMLLAKVIENIVRFR
jgi:hypothetical protein